MFISVYNATDLCRPKAPGKKWQLTLINYYHQFLSYWAIRDSRFKKEKKHFYTWFSFEISNLIIKVDIYLIDT